MNIYLHTLAETANIILPIFLLVVCGFVLRQIDLIGDQFVVQSSSLVFNLALPTLLFVSIAQADFAAVFNGAQLVFVAVALIVSTAILYWLASLFIKEPENLGVFVQGACRSNYAIMGLALSYIMFGEAGLPAASLLLATMIPLFNVLSVIVLSLPHQQGLQLWTMLKSVLTNPLILGILLALPFSLLHWPIPELVLHTGNYLRDLTLPLALLAIGGSLQLKHLRTGTGSTSTLAFVATGLKIVVIPTVLTFCAWLYGFRGEDLALLLLLFGCPTAAGTFVMASAMQGNRQLAANIIALTALGSVFTLGTGIYLLKIFNL